MLNELAKTCHFIAESKGFYPCHRNAMARKIVEEALEADHEIRKESAKQGEELADVVITALSVSHALGIDIHQAITDKLEYNKTRQWRHGKE